MRGLVQTPLLVALTLALFSGSPAMAELAILVTGDYLKIDAYRLVDDDMTLELRGGGSLTLAVSRIERILDDEIVPEIERAPDSVEGFDLEFREHYPEPEGSYGRLIYDTARQFNLNPSLLVAMTRAESAFDSKAISIKGARGLMQLMPATAERFGVATSELFVPERNLEAGARYVGWLIDRFDGDLIKVLAAYNAGEGAVDRFGGVPPYRETQGYVKRIVGFLGLKGS